MAILWLLVEEKGFVNFFSKRKAANPNLKDDEIMKMFYEEKWWANVTKWKKVGKAKVPVDFKRVEIEQFDKLMKLVEPHFRPASDFVGEAPQEVKRPELRGERSELRNNFFKQPLYKTALNSIFELAETDSGDDEEEYFATKYFVHDQNDYGRLPEDPYEHWIVTGEFMPLEFQNEFAALERIQKDVKRRDEIEKQQEKVKKQARAFVQSLNNALRLGGYAAFIHQDEKVVREVMKQAEAIGLYLLPYAPGRYETVQRFGGIQKTHYVIFRKVKIKNANSNIKIVRRPNRTWVLEKTALSSQQAKELAQREILLRRPGIANFDTEVDGLASVIYQRMRERLKREKTMLRRLREKLVAMGKTDILKHIPDILPSDSDEKFRMPWFRETPLPVMQSGRFIQESFELIDGINAAQFIHGDFRPGNLIIARDKSGDNNVHVKLIDFGLMREIGERISPELLEEFRRSGPHDVFGLERTGPTQSAVAELSALRATLSSDTFLLTTSVDAFGFAAAMKRILVDRANPPLYRLISRMSEDEQFVIYNRARQALAATMREKDRVTTVRGVYEFFNPARAELRSDVNGYPDFIVRRLKNIDEQVTQIESAIGRIESQPTLTNKDQLEALRARLTDLQRKRQASLDYKPSWSAFAQSNHDKRAELRANELMSSEEVVHRVEELYADQELNQAAQGALHLLREMHKKAILKRGGARIAQFGTAAGMRLALNAYKEIARKLQDHNPQKVEIDRSSQAIHGLISRELKLNEQTDRVAINRIVDSVIERLNNLIEEPAAASRAELRNRDLTRQLENIGDTLNTIQAIFDKHVSMLYSATELIPYHRGFEKRYDAVFGRGKFELFKRELENVARAFSFHGTENTVFKRNGALGEAITKIHRVEVSLRQLITRGSGERDEKLENMFEDFNDVSADLILIQSETWALLGDRDQVTQRLRTLQAQSRSPQFSTANKNELAGATFVAFTLDQVDQTVAGFFEEKAKGDRILEREGRKNILSQRIALIHYAHAIKLLEQDESHFVNSLEELPAEAGGGVLESRFAIASVYLTAVHLILSLKGVPNDDVHLADIPEFKLPDYFRNAVDYISDFETKFKQIRERLDWEVAGEVEARINDLIERFEKMLRVRISLGVTITQTEYRESLAYFLAPRFREDRELFATHMRIIKMLGRGNFTTRGLQRIGIRLNLLKSQYQNYYKKDATDKDDIRNNRSLNRTIRLIDSTQQIISEFFALTAKMEKKSKETTGVEAGAAGKAVAPRAELRRSPRVSHRVANDVDFVAPPKIGRLVLSLIIHDAIAATDAARPDIHPAEFKMGLAQLNYSTEFDAVVGQPIGNQVPKITLSAESQLASLLLALLANEKFLEALDGKLQIGIADPTGRFRSKLRFVLDSYQDPIEKAIVSRSIRTSGDSLLAFAGKRRGAAVFVETPNELDLFARAELRDLFVAFLDWSHVSQKDQEAVSQVLIPIAVGAARLAQTKSDSEIARLRSELRDLGFVLNQTNGRSGATIQIRSILDRVLEAKKGKEEISASA